MINRYSIDSINTIWSDYSKFLMWFKIELAACDVQETEGIVPKGTTQRIYDISQGTIPFDAPSCILEIEQTTKHDVIAFLTYLERQFGSDVKWLHLGLTSSDICDTAFALQLKQANMEISATWSILTDVLKEKAIAFKHTQMMGRTHGMHAEPTTLGLVFLSFYNEAQRNAKRFKDACKQLEFGKMSGSVGVYSNTSPTMEKLVMEKLGLQPEDHATQVVPRDRHAQYFQTLALMAANIERIALTIRHWQRTEVAEAAEGFSSGQKGSSAMPHKKNPILSENLCGLSRMMRAYADAAVENIPLWHERDISHSSVERIIAPDATNLISFMALRCLNLVSNLYFNMNSIEKWATETDVHFSQAVMLQLIKNGMDRQTAYEFVQEWSFKAKERNMPLSDVVEEISRDDLLHCFHMEHHLGYVDEIYKRHFD